MLWDEHANGLLSGDEFAPRWLLFAYGIVRYVNGKSGKSNVGITRLALDLGYESSNHGFHKGLKVLLRLGFLTQRGQVGRAAQLSLSIPDALKDKEDAKGNPIYAPLLDSVVGNLVTVADTSKSAPIPESKALPTPTLAVADEPEPDWSQDTPVVDDGWSVPKPTTTPPSPRRANRFDDESRRPNAA
ncbi:hypothetical protein ACFQVD_00845 [Streptosporangium amethystogenes subsp. fukuiense]|uniref:Uncharacterized protein n=1 Tax=Streptosporangium amethystogenes subsp. fukuiense TaxID=698418 RepID=A0ABW2SQU2_9ACTN